VTTSQLAIVLVRLGAVWIVVTTIQYAGNAITFFEGTNNVIVVVTHLFPLVIGALVWLFPAHVARSVASDDSRAIPGSDKLAQKLFGLGVALLGLYLLVYGILDGIYFALHAIWEQDALGMNTNDARAGLIVSAIQIPLGIALILGRRGLLRLFYRFRYREDADL
jgi:hypothetical protein